VTAIEDFAKMKNADLVMMVTHERGWLEDLFHKSITKDMTLHSNVPFMTIPDHHVAEFNKSYNANYW
jgi:nucleotide-binding universal stress UspA family protein